MLPVELLGCLRLLNFYTKAIRNHKLPSDLEGSNVGTKCILATKLFYDGVFLILRHTRPAIDQIQTVDSLQVFLDWINVLTPLHIEKVLSIYEDLLSVIVLAEDDQSWQEVLDVDRVNCTVAFFKVATREGLIVRRSEQPGIELNWDKYCQK